MKQLREYYSAENKFLALMPNITEFAFAALADSIDLWLLFWYKSILVSDDNYLSYINNWIALRAEDLNAMYNTLLYNYNPLTDRMIDRSEDIASKESTTESSSKLYGKNKTVTSMPKIKNSEYRTTNDDKTEGRLDNYTVSEPLDATAASKQTIETSQEADAQDRQGISNSSSRGTDVSMTGAHGETVSAQDVEVRHILEESRESSPADLIEKELRLRADKSFIKIFCDIFVKECTSGVFDI